MTSETYSRRRALKTGLAAGVASGLPFSGAAFAQTREVLEMSKGADDAQVTVVEYASFTCPHCARFHNEVYPQIRANFIDSGKVRFVLREVYFDRYGLWAGMLARCGGPMRYFGVLDLIFADQAGWLGDREPATVINNLYGLGRQAGMSDADMEACLQDADWAKALVEEYQKNAEADDVSGTPSFVINGEKVGNMGYAEFADFLTAKLES